MDLRELGLEDFGLRIIDAPEGVLRDLAGRLKEEANRRGLGLGLEPSWAADRDELERRLPHTEAFSPILLHGYDDCVLGVWTTADECRVVYDTRRMVRKLMDQGLDHEEAWEFFGYNVERTAQYLGKDGPILMDPLEEA